MAQKGQIIIATNNDGKLREFQKLFVAKNIEVTSLKNYPEIGKIAETGMTFEENATIKASAVAKKTKLPVLADDSGLEVDALNGRPGIFSARYAGDHDDAANNAKLLSELAGVPVEKRTATFHTTLVLMKPDDSKLVVDGELRGRILAVPRGDNGFGYDPLFLVPEKNQSLAEMTAEEKNTISHRGRASQKLLKVFDDWW
ncbi:XTP/dITP diphosphatase [Pediococcus ethanolidurans]|uniref:XTP/dITP diphosphatase n=1 Tax=Pediococcus ethanolidurans TaxID=319653 RepID=UPI001C1F0EDB|nr:XTP/dITP diphosphatase [Pediococcus ethanolidurans]MBU7554303.1 XTP/dITP diphosphatase [Pediococcus ethanolidurans]MBU7562533.1 XTP/dITP diphosphatase [Pediococcus ethanolidurans]MCT4397368.1 XTP/dITP diphosphatase [Pediococcus ethanolidurans]MCV3314440.1 XTP/dITP diphosphatase [Pediococcus ethanolidurans]MCV3321184.1 XTP/dITP diphosphatase [Pediococcus ethanolidurans]